MPEIIKMFYRDIEEFKTLSGYTIEGMWYPRVTKILDVKAKPGLDNFFKEVGDYASAEEIKNKSAEEGTLLHGVLERIAVGDTVDIPDSVRPAIEAFQQFNATRGIVFHADHVERQIWSQRYRYAGTVDALATIDGKFGVLDIKTSAGFYPEYNLQTAAYVSALQEFELKRALALPRDIETRWILRVDQRSSCKRCKAMLREKGGRRRIKNTSRTDEVCPGDSHEWEERRGEVELREFPHVYKDLKAFIAAKILWEWENGYWLRQIGYV